MADGQAASRQRARAPRPFPYGAVLSGHRPAGAKSIPVPGLRWRSADGTVFVVVPAEYKAQAKGRIRYRVVCVVDGAAPRFLTASGRCDQQGDIFSLAPVELLYPTSAVAQAIAAFLHAK